MEKVKKILRKLWIVPFPWSYVIALPTFLFVSIVLEIGDVGVIAYVAYLVSFYGLIVFCIAIFRDIPKAVKAFFQSEFYASLCRLPFVGKLFQNESFRIRFGLSSGVVMNLLYVVLKVTTGILYHSLWLVCFGVYYLLLAVLRMFIVEKDLKYDETVGDTLADYRRYRLCGINLLVLNVVLGIITRLAVELKAEIDYPGTLIFGMALYTFYALTSASMSVLKYRNHERIMYYAASVSSFTAALVAMLSLEIAMTGRFGADDYTFRRNMTGITGMVVFILIFIMALQMIIKGTRCINAKQKEDA